MSTTYIELTGTQQYDAVFGGGCGNCGLAHRGDDCRARFCDSCTAVWLADRPTGSDDGRPHKEDCPDCVASEARTKTLDDVRELLNWLEAHPEVPIPDELGSESLGLSIYQWDSKEQAQTMARAMGTFEKQFDGDYLRLIKKFGSGVKVRAIFSRSQVCERVVTGTREIPEQVIPARTEEISEWKCSSILSAQEAA